MSQEKIIIWLDTNSNPEKWCIDVQRKNSGGEYESILHSGSADFPINVDDFGSFEEDLLIQSLKRAFPSADIGMKF
jgi:hypothetical protein